MASELHEPGRFAPETHRAPMASRPASRTASRLTPAYLGLAVAAGLTGLAGLAEGQVITTIAGGSIGDGGTARSAGLNTPNAITVDAAGNLFIADTGNHRIRRVAFPPPPASPPGTAAGRRR
jgi:hypothetical protein